VTSTSHGPCSWSVGASQQLVPRALDSCRWVAPTVTRNLAVHVALQVVTVITATGLSCGETSACRFRTGILQEGERIEIVRIIVNRIQQICSRPTVHSKLL